MYAVSLYVKHVFRDNNNVGISGEIRGPLVACELASSTVTTMCVFESILDIREIGIWNYPC